MAGASFEAATLAPVAYIASRNAAGIIERPVLASWRGQTRVLGPHWSDCLGHKEVRRGSLQCLGAGRSSGACAEA